MRKLVVAAVFALCPVVLTAQQTLVLRDGRTISGRFVSGGSGTIVFRNAKGVSQRFNVRDVQSIQFTRAGSERGNYPHQANREQSRAYRATAVIPAGTRVSVRTDQTIDSKAASVGQLFPAQISNDVADETGAVVIPRGSPAQLAIRQVKTPGAVTGSSSLALDLASVTVDGQRYLVNSGTVTKSGKSGIGANKRTLKMLGGGAALGTLLGAVAGGGKGAGIGAAVGAAGGGTAQVLTRGSHVKVPAETVLTFSLEQPLRLDEQRQ